MGVVEGKLTIESIEVWTEVTAVLLEVWMCVESFGCHPAFYLREQFAAKGWRRLPSDASSLE